MTDAATDGLTRVQEVEHAQRSKAWAGATSFVLLGQVLFGAFVVGHNLGPFDMPLREVLIGMTVSLLFTLIWAPYFARRRRRQGADFSGVLREGRHKRNLLIFEDCFIVDGEVILFDHVHRFEAGGTTLSVRYRDPKHDGPVLREFEAPEPVVHRLIRRFPSPERTPDASPLREAHR
ncbi:MAG: hypothetical protein ACFB9M_03085 [Myxococcota bacterium]